MTCDSINVVINECKYLHAQHKHINANLCPNGRHCSLSKFTQEEINEHVDKCHNDEEMVIVDMIKPLLVVEAPVNAESTLKAAEIVPFVEVPKVEESTPAAVVEVPVAVEEVPVIAEIVPFVVVEAPKVGNQTPPNDPPKARTPAKAIPHHKKQEFNKNKMRDSPKPPANVDLKALTMAVALMLNLKLNENTNNGWRVATMKDVEEQGMTEGPEIFKNCQHVDLYPPEAMLISPSGSLIRGGICYQHIENKGRFCSKHAHLHPTFKKSNATPKIE